MSNVNDGERLLVLVEARIRDFEKNMQKASGTAGREFGQMRKTSQSATRSMERDAVQASRRIDQSMASVSTQFGALGRAASIAGKTVAGALAIGGLDALIGEFRATATGVANIGNEARRAGLSVKAFQELSFVADQNRISIDALVDGMKELSLRADEYIVTGAGSSAEAFKRLGFSASDLKDRLKDPSKLLVEIIRRMEQLGDKAAQIRISDELFGGEGGEQFVELLNRGSAGIQQMVKDANDFGLVLDEKMIAKADEVDRKFSLLARTVGTGLKQAILDATGALTGFLDQFNSLGKQQAGTLQKGIETNLADMKKIRDEIATLRAQQNDALLPSLKNSNEPQIRILEAQLAKLQADDDNLRALLKDRTGGQVYGPTQPKPVAASPAMTFTPISTNSTDLLMSRLAAGKNREHVDGLAGDLKEALNKALASAPDSVRNATTLNSGFRSFERQAQLFAEAVKKYGSPEAARKWVAPPGKSQHQDGEAADLGFQTAEARKWFHANAGNFGLTFPMAHEPWHVETTGARRKVNDEAFREKYEANEEQAASYDRIIASAGQYVIQQQTEREALALTAVEAARLRYEHEMLAEAEAAGVTVTSDKARAIGELAQRMAEAEVATEQFAESQELARQAAETMKGLASEGIKGFIQDLRSGITVSEALANALGRIGDRLMDMALDSTLSAIFGGGDGGASGGGGGGVFGSIIGSLFGGGRAKGGPVDGSKFYMIGEEGPELFAPGRSGTIIPNDRLGVPTLREPMMPAAAGGRTMDVKTHVTVGVSVDKGGTLKAFVENVATEKAERASSRAVTAYRQSGVQDDIEAHQNDPRKRG